ncbi:MAG: amidohydrolase [Armatimonadetes bacterium]|nr:amidohydrolase [Armatimonadota bacterium]
MILDSHVHLKHGDAAKTEYTAEQIVGVMDAVGIDRSVVFAMSTTTVDSIARAIAAVQQFPARLIPYAYADPAHTDANRRELRAAIERDGFRGIKLHLGVAVPSDDDFAALCALAADTGVPILTDFAGRADVLGRLAARCPEAVILAAHLGRYLARDEALIESFVRSAEQHPRVYLDVSGVVLPERIVDAVARVGAERVLFGTDGPHTDPNLNGFARSAVEQIRGLGLPPADEAMVLGGSAARLLGF